MNIISKIDKGYQVIQATNLLILEAICKGKLTIEPEETGLVIRDGEKKVREIVPKMGGIPFEDRTFNLSPVKYLPVIKRLKELSERSPKSSLDGAVMRVQDQTNGGQIYDINIKSIPYSLLYGDSLILTATPVTA